MATRHDGGAAARELTGTATRKRPLEEVVAPSFVAMDDQGGAYRISEMPKRFILERMVHKDRFVDAWTLTWDARDAKDIARHNRVRSYANALIRKLDALDATRAAAAPSS